MLNVKKVIDKYLWKLIKIVKSNFKSYFKIKVIKKYRCKYILVISIFYFYYYLIFCCYLCY